jgi:4-amino-4-deoxy-L-arabinose transferase-like glycosyltransferase
MIASGIAGGCAVLCKYSGALPIVIIFGYALIHERWLFKKKTFLLSLAIPMVMFIPWLEWNLRIYGISYFANNAEIVSIMRKLQNIWFVFPIIVGLIVGWVVIDRKYSEMSETVLFKKVKTVVGILLFGSIIIILKTHIMNSLNIDYVPENGWRMGMFKHAEWYFYLGRLIELSPIYVFSFAGIFIQAVDEKHRKEYLYLLFVSVFIFAFYILWGNYQCRYITSVVTPLIVMSAAVQIYLFEKINKIESRVFRDVVYACAIMLVGYLIIQTVRIDITLAMPNATCYY